MRYILLPGIFDEKKGLSFWFFFWSASTGENTQQNDEGIAKTMVGGKQKRNV